MHVHERAFMNSSSLPYSLSNPIPIQTHLESAGPSPLSNSPHTYTHIHTHKNSSMYTQHSPYLTLSMAIHTLNSLKNLWLYLLRVLYTHKRVLTTHSAVACITKLTQKLYTYPLRVCRILKWHHSQHTVNTPHYISQRFL